MAMSVGFIGVGNMGNPMAGNVLKGGFAMTVFDKNPKAMANLVEAGAHGAASVRELADRSEVVMTCLPASPDVEALYLEPDGLIDLAKPGTVLIDLSSVLPSTPRKLEPRAQAMGCVGIRVETIKELVGELDRVAGAQEPVVLDVVTTEDAPFWQVQSPFAKEGPGGE